MTKVEIYSKESCAYSFRAESLLDAKGVKDLEIDIEQDPSQEQELLNRCGSSTVPQIFINGVHIGGANELGALETAGRLDELLNS
jgi:glutaredoxin 3